MFRCQQIDYKMCKLYFIICVMCIWIHPVYTGYDWNDSAQTLAPNGRKNFTQNSATATSVLPTFDMSQSAHVTVYEGQMAYLPCIVQNLGDRVVSWIRTKDLHILTSYIYRFTANPRFDIIHHPESENWTLQVNNTKMSDSGYYECQVNTDPKIKFPVTLTVIDSNQLHDSPYPRTKWNNGRVARISGPYEQYVQEGSTVTFTCEVSPMEDKHFISEIPSSTINDDNNHISGAIMSSSSSLSTSKLSPGPKSAVIYPTHAPIEWTHRGRLVSFQAARGGISLDTDYRAQVSTSRLTISMVTVNDSGEYQCAQGDAVPATIVLLIEDAEHSEAMQRDMAAYNKSSSANVNLHITISVQIFLIYLYYKFSV